MKHVRNMKVRMKISLLLGLAALSTSLVFWLGFRGIEAASKEVSVLTELNIPLTDALSKVAFNSAEQWCHVERAMRYGLDRVQDNRLKDAFDIESQMILKHHQAIIQEIARAGRLIEQLLEKTGTPEAQKYLLKIGHELRSINNKHTDYHVTINQTLTIISRGEEGETLASTDKISNIRSQNEEANSLENLLLAIEDFMQYSTMHSQETRQTAIAQMLLVSSLILLSQLVLGIFISHSISKPLFTAVTVANRIANGDRHIDVEVNRHDESGQLLKSMMVMSAAVSESEAMLREQATDLEQSNKQLSSEISERERVEEQLRESEQAAVQLAQRAEAARLDVKQLNQELQDVNEGLEEAVHERTRELEGFSYSVSHDLRAPLRAVDGFSRVLQKDYGRTLGEEGNRLLEIVRTNVQRMGTLIDDLLAFSRLGRKAIHPGHVNMDELARDVYDELKSAVSERQVNLTIRNVAPAWGDRNLIQQVFVNLISNAIKFTGERDIGKIDIWSETKDELNMYCVRDNGAGFDMQYADKLFGVFQRLHSDEEFEGTGIGLALVHRIIKRHNGHIWAESEPDKGATFYFTLPPTKQHDDSEQNGDIEPEELLIASTGDQNNEA